MSKRTVFLALLIALLLSMLTAATGFAEESNRNEVRANLAKGGWYLVWGDLINEGDYLEFGEAITLAVATENPAPIYAFFDYQLRTQLNKIKQSAPDIGEQALMNLLVRAFNSRGTVLRHGKLEVSAGLATYKRWEVVIYDEPRTYRCKQEFPWGGWTWSVCTTVKRVKKTVPLPNNFQPYFRFRWASGGGRTTTPTGGSTTVKNPYAVLCIKNTTDWAINYSYRWGDRQWKSAKVSDNGSRSHAWKYAPGSTSSPTFHIRYDADFTSSKDYEQYTLSRYQAANQTCSGGRLYTFKRVGSSRVKLYASK